MTAIMWPAFDSRPRSHMRVKLVVGFLLAPRDFSPNRPFQYSGFPLSQKKQPSKFQLDLKVSPVSTACVPLTRRRAMKGVTLGRDHSRRRIRTFAKVCGEMEFVWFTRPLFALVAFSKPHNSFNAIEEFVEVCFGSFLVLRSPSDEKQKTRNNTQTTKK